MATVYWRNGTAYLNWSEGGQQHRKSLGRITPYEADTARHGKELELRTGQRLFVSAALFDDHLKGYLTWHRAQYPDSHFRVEQIARMHWGWFMGKALSQIDTKFVEDWKLARLREASAGTVSKELRQLHAVFEKAIRWKQGIVENPCEEVEPPQDLNSEPIHWYERHELQMLYRRRHGQTWRLMANTGMRRKEALKLKWAQVDIPGRMLQILSTSSARTKSGKWREVPLSDGALEALERLKKVRRLDGFVLPRITAPSLSRAFVTDAERLKLCGSLHSLRHSYAAHMVMEGVPLRTLQVLMGHASFATTERYAHIGKNHLRDQAMRVSL